MRKPIDLEGRLREAIGIFGKKLDVDASLRRYFDVSIANFAKRNAIKATEDNPFATHLFLTRSLKEAYQSGNLDSLESVQNWMGQIGDNSITYSLIMGEQQLQPFSNETTGQQVSFVNNIFDVISRAAGGLTVFYGYLRSLVTEFSIERNGLMYEIMDSNAYKAAKSALPPNANTGPEKRKLREELRKVYREEELKRLDRVVRVAEKAEEIYRLVARLFDGVREYKPD